MLFREIFTTCIGNICGQSMPALVELGDLVCMATFAHGCRWLIQNMNTFMLYRTGVISVYNMAVLAANFCCGHCAVTVLFNNARRALAVTGDALVRTVLKHIDLVFGQRSRRNGRPSDDNDDQGQYKDDN